jgi:hypothetical protein
MPAAATTRTASDTLDTRARDGAVPDSARTQVSSHLDHDSRGRILLPHAAPDLSPVLVAVASVAAPLIYIPGRS